MAFSSHCKPSSIWFTAEAALVLFLVVHSSAAPLMNNRQVVDESERNITKQILLGMRLINKIDNMTALEARDSNQSEFLSVKVLCNMYDLYRDYTTALISNIQPDHPLYAKYSAAQDVAWEAMQSACQWTNSSSTVLPDDGCTLNSIARICHILHAKTMVNDFQKDIKKIYNISTPDVSEWRGQARCGAEIINAIRQ